MKESIWHLLKSNKYSQNMQIDLCYHELDSGVEGWLMEHTKQTKMVKTVKKTKKHVLLWKQKK